MIMILDIRAIRDVVLLGSTRAYVRVNIWNYCCQIDTHLFICSLVHKIDYLHQHCCRRDDQSSRASYLYGILD